MFLTNLDMYISLEKAYLIIDNEVDQYFKRIEDKTLKFLNRGNSIYNFKKSDILKNTFHNKDFEEFLLNLIYQICNQLNANYIEAMEEGFNVDLESISQFNMNFALNNQYKFSYHLAKNIEKNIDEVVENNLFNRVSNKAMNFFLGKISPSDIISSFTNLSSDDFNKRHKIDIQRRIKGILINFKVRLKNTLKSQVYDNLLCIQKNNIKTA
ncbi:hypothetical protein R9X47_04425 [Wukongibacter baidiensis]|uniref:hypothetical protein n=1 Tax=Wukongibacter baidiensis TaxID=1723361 RepID=UPI003D7FFFBA